MSASLDGIVGRDAIESIADVQQAITDSGSITTTTVTATTLNTNLMTIANDQISAIGSSTNIVVNNSTSGSFKIDNLQVKTNTLSSNNTNGDIILAPNGAGTVKTDNLQLDGNTISSTDTNGNIILAPDGAGTVKTDNLQFDGNTISSTDTNGNIILAPDGAGNIVLGTMTLNADQTVSASQDDYVLKYDHSTGTIGLEAETGGGGGGSNWTTTGADIYRASQVGIGANSSTINSQLMVKDTGASHTAVQVTAGASQNCSVKLSRGNGTWSSAGNETIGLHMDTNRLLISKLTQEGNNLSGYSGSTVDVDVQNSRMGIACYPYGASIANTLQLGSIASGRTESIKISSNVGAGVSDTSLEVGVDSTSTFIECNDSANAPRALEIRQGTNSVVQSFDTNGNVGFTNNGSGTEAFTITSNTTRLITLLNTGYLGIGTSSIRAPLEVISVNMGITLDSGNRRYFNTSLPLTGDTGTWAFNDVSIYGHGDIVSNGYFLSHSASTFSDRRIKDNIVDVQDDQCLKKLRLIKPKRYTYKDVIRRGLGQVWGFIAQEVKETLDYAVSTIEKEIPNIYKLATVSSDRKALIFAEPIVFQNEHKRVVLKTHQNKNVEVLVVSHTSTSLTLQEEINGEDISVENQVFVYGQVVSDFHHLDKNAIFTVAVSALQEVDRQQQLHKNKISTLEARMALLEQRLNNAGL